MRNFLKFVLVFIFIFAANLSAFAKNTTVTIISDTHIKSDKQNNKMTPSIDKLIKAVNQANADTSSCVVFLGDNVQGANKHDITMFAKIIKRLKKPYYVIVGNRDISRTKGLTKKEYFEVLNKFCSNKIDTLPTYKKHEDLIFVFLSGANETFPSYKGYYKSNELAFLDETLTKFEDKKVIIFQHFPVIAPKDDEARQTVKPELYLDVLSRHKNVLAVVSGHYHAEGISEHNNVKHISVAGLSQNGEYEQIKIFKNKNGTYSITTKILNVD